jgi:mono/diheme cytochrome c family protein
MSAEPNQPLPAEEREPTAGMARGPIWLVVLLVALFYWGAQYLDQNGGEFQAAVYRPFRSGEELAALQPRDKTGQLLELGKRLYSANCEACHQASGSGSTQNNCPPLAGSDWVTAAGPGRLIRMVLNGGQGPITVSGQLWQGGVMTPFRDVLTSDDEVAAVLTYIRLTWGNKAPIVTPEQVKSVRDKTADRSSAWTATELLNVPETE